MGANSPGLQHLNSFAAKAARINAATVASLLCVIWSVIRRSSGSVRSIWKNAKWFAISSGVDAMFAKQSRYSRNAWTGEACFLRSCSNLKPLSKDIITERSFINDGLTVNNRPEEKLAAPVLPDYRSLAVNGRSQAMIVARIERVNSCVRYATVWP